MNANKYDVLKLENQICFPLYACGKEITRLYKPFLDKIDLTYTQYVCMMVIWEEKVIKLKELGRRLFLDSGTLTPLLKKLEAKNFITRKMDKDDKRDLLISVTKTGLKLRDDALKVPSQIISCVKLDTDDAKELYLLLHKVLKNFKK